MAPLTVIVEFYAGYGSLSRSAKKIGFTKSITVDNDKRRKPNKCFSTLNKKEMDQLGNEVAALKVQGYRVAVHTSPPCQEFSIAGRNARSQKTPAQNAVAMKQAIKLVNVSLNFAKKYADVFTLENPGTGSLWTEHAHKIKHDISKRRKLDICRYGSFMKKNMCLAFSSNRLKKRFGKSRKCLGKSRCSSMFRNPKTNFTTFKHVGVSDVPLSLRIAFPQQLCIDLMSVVHEELRVINEVGPEDEATEESEESEATDEDSEVDEESEENDGSASSEDDEDEDEDEPVPGPKVVEFRHIRPVDFAAQKCSLLFEGSSQYRRFSFEDAMQEEWLSEPMFANFCNKADLWVVERIVRRKPGLVRIKWLGFDHVWNTWEPAEGFE